MTTPNEQWTSAFDAASGREAQGQIDAKELAQVQRVLDARRAQRNIEPCPPAVLARIQGLLGARQPSLLQMVFDSLTSPAAAARGSGTRMMRFEQGSIGLDVRLRIGDYDVVHVDIAAHDLPEGAKVSILAPPEDDLDIVLDEHGVGSATLPATVPTFVVVVGRGGRPFAQSQPIAI